MFQTTGRRIFIGDVHGHYEGLNHLLEQIAPGMDDEVYFTGDLIDRGPQSANVVRLVRDNFYGCVLGNHEQMLLDVFPHGKDINSNVIQHWLHNWGYATATSYHDVDQILEDVEWMRSLPLYIDLDDIWLVHAGIHPHIPLHEQTSNELCWIRDEFHSISKPYFQDKLVIIGHTITFTMPGVQPGEVVRGHGWIDIDTGAYHHRSGWLTGLDITNEKVYQVNVYDHSVRVLPLDEVSTSLDKGFIPTRKSRHQIFR